MKTKIMIVAALIATFSGPQAFAMGKKPRFETEPSQHAVDLATFNGTYKLSAEVYAKAWDSIPAGRIECPGHNLPTINLRYDSKNEIRSNKPYYNESIGFWTKAQGGSLLTDIEFIDQGTEEIDTKKGPSDLTDWLGCKWFPMSADCEYGLRHNDKYYREHGIEEEGYTVKYSVGTTKTSIIGTSDYQEYTQYADRREEKSASRQEILEKTADGAILRNTLEGAIIRECVYQRQ